MMVLFNALTLAVAFLSAVEATPLYVTSFYHFSFSVFLFLSLNVLPC